VGERDRCLGADATLTWAGDQENSSFHLILEVGDYGRTFCAESILRHF